MEMIDDINATFAKVAFCHQFNDHSMLPSPNLRKNPTCAAETTMNM
jgi:hypothetical protein